MKKSIKIILLALFCTTLFSCGENKGKNENHSHTFKEWIITREATCEHEGKMARYCDCGEKQEETLPKKDHIYDSNGICSVCGATRGDTPETTEIIATETPEITPLITQAPTETESLEPTEEVTATTAGGETLKPTVKPTPTPTLVPTAKPDSYYTRSGDYIYFGSYPQSEVTDAKLKASLTSAAGSQSAWNSYDYCIKSKVSSFMKYKDITYNGAKYRGVCFTQYRPDWVADESSEATSQQDNYGYYTNTIYWFKYEPIKWKIIAESKGDAFLVSDVILDARDFDGDEDYSNNYADSQIRKWLNGSFCNTAFTGEEILKIKTSLVDNSAKSTGNSENPYACPNTYDKVFILSRVEAIERNYGFGIDSQRIKTSTSYAKAQGVSDTCYWWLRSPVTKSGFARTVDVDGEIGGNYVDRTNAGIVPAIHLTIK